MDIVKLVLAIALLLPQATYCLSARELKGFLSLLDLAPPREDPHELASIEGFLKKELGGKPFTYIINPGNAGDALIQYGTMLVFDHLGLDYHLGDPNVQYQNSTLVYAGAGNLVGLYPHCKFFLRNNAPLLANNSILLLPATVKDEDEALKVLGPNVKIVTRERMSYDYVRRLVSPESAFLSKDMAFYIQDFDPMFKTYRGTFPQEWKVGHMFRVDSEQTNISLPDDNHDWEHELPGVGVVKDAEKAAYKQHLQNVAHRLFKKVAFFNEIWTNRFHLCVAASMLGRVAHCLPNSYWKNEAMFNFSIREHFRDVHFEDAAAASFPLEISRPSPSLLGWASLAPSVFSARPDAPPTHSSAEGVLFIAVSAAALALPRLLGSLLQTRGATEAALRRLDGVALLLDVVVWYTATPFYIATSLPLVTAGGSSLRLIAVTFAQVFLGVLLLPMGGMQQILKADRRVLLSLAVAGCAFFCGSMLVLRSLQRSSVLFVSNARCLELVTTALIATWATGEELGPLQTVGLVLALAGGLMAACPSATAFRVVSSVREPLCDMATVMLANAMYSIRNVVLSESADRADGISKVALFGATCGFAAIPALLGLCFTSMAAGTTRIGLRDVHIDAVPLAISASAFLLYNAASFFILARVKPIIHSLLLTGKRVAATILACIWVHQLPTRLGAFSICLTSVGCALYEVEKRTRSVVFDAKRTKLKRPSALRRIVDSDSALPFCASVFIIVSAALVAW